MTAREGEQAAQGEPRKPVRPWLWPILAPILRRLAARRTDCGDERPLQIGPFWLHVYRCGSRSYGTGRWYGDWHALVGWPGGHRSVHIVDAPEETA